MFSSSTRTGMYLHPHTVWTPASARNCQPGKQSGQGDAPALHTHYTSSLNVAAPHTLKRRSKRFLRLARLQPRHSWPREFLWNAFVLAQGRSTSWWGTHSPSDVVRPWPHVYRYLHGPAAREPEQACPGSVRLPRRCNEPARPRGLTHRSEVRTQAQRRSGPGCQVKTTCCALVAWVAGGSAGRRTRGGC